MKRNGYPLHVWKIIRPRRQVVWNCAAEHAHLVSDHQRWLGLGYCFQSFATGQRGDNLSMELKVYSYKKGSTNNLSSIWQYETWAFFRHCYQLHRIGGRGFYLTLELSSLGEWLTLCFIGWLTAMFLTNFVLSARCPPWPRLSWSFMSSSPCPGRFGWTWLRRSWCFFVGEKGPGKTSKDKVANSASGNRLIKTVGDASFSSKT